MPAMRAAILRSHGGPEAIEPGDWPDPEPGPGEVLIEVVTASLNRRDVWIRRSPARVERPVVLGSDAAGVVAAVGEGIVEHAVGDDVIVLPSVNWGDREDAPGEAFEILGVPRQGTHAERVVVPAENVYPRPRDLSWEESAALPLAGLTAWRALVTRGGVTAGTKVLVTGAGGGVATFLVQIARELGAEVLVTTSSPEKLARAKELGASGGADWRDPEWPAQIRTLSGGGVDVVVDSAGAPVYPGALTALRDGGTFVNFGDTAGEEASVDVFRLFWGQLSIHGTTMGSPREFAALLRHVAEASWRPIVDVALPLDQCREAHARMDEADRFGKVVLRMR